MLGKQINGKRKKRLTNTSFLPELFFFPELLLLHSFVLHFVLFLKKKNAARTSLQTLTRHVCNTIPKLVIIMYFVVVVVGFCFATSTTPVTLEWEYLEEDVCESEEGNTLYL